MFGPVKKEFSVLRVCLTVVGVLWACPVAAQRSAVEGCSVPLATIDVTQPTFDDELTIFDSIVIADLQVFVDVTHTFVGDLDIAVTHNGTTVGLHAGAGGSGDDIFATFNDAGAPYGTEPFDCDCHLAPSGPGSRESSPGGRQDGWTDGPSICLLHVL